MANGGLWWYPLLPQHKEKRSKDKNTLTQWCETVAQQMVHLSKPQAFVLALWSFGIVMARSCALTSVAFLLAELVGKKEAAMRERLRDLYREASAKKGRSGLSCALKAYRPLPDDAPGRVGRQAGQSHR